MSKLLLCGKTGLLGQALHHLLPSGTLAPDRNQMDFKDNASLWSFLQQQRPSVIINAAAYTQVDQAELYPDLCDQINHQATTVLADYALQHNALLVHFSTDYVFNGQRRSPYRELDSPQPLNVYGQSKLAAEQSIQRSGCPHLIFRLAWLYGGSGQHFVRSIAERALRQKQLAVVDDQIGAPTSVDWLAPIIIHAIQHHQNQQLPSGVYHLSPSGQCSWYEFAVTIIQQLQQLGLSPQIQPEQIQRSNTLSYPSLAQRPAYSVLDSTLFFCLTGLNRPHWQDLLPTAIRTLAPKLLTNSG